MPAAFLLLPQHGHPQVSAPFLLEWDRGQFWGSNPVPCIYYHWSTFSALLSRPKEPNSDLWSTGTIAVTSGSPSHLHHLSLSLLTSAGCSQSSSSSVLSGNTQSGLTQLLGMAQSIRLTVNINYTSSKLKH